MKCNLLALKIHNWHIGCVELMVGNYFFCSQNLKKHKIKPLHTRAPGFQKDLANIKLPESLKMVPCCCPRLLA